MEYLWNIYGIPMEYLWNMMVFNGYDSGTDEDWRYLPYIIYFFWPMFLAYGSGNMQNMARNIGLTYLHFRILKFPLMRTRFRNYD